MTLKKLTLKAITFAGLVTSTLFMAQSANAAKFDFSYSGEGLYADGVLTATDLGDGKYQVTDIVGERNGASISSLIPSGLFNNDNLIFPSQSSVVDSQGFAYQVGNNVSVFSTDSGYKDFSLNPDRTTTSTTLNSLTIKPFEPPTSLVTFDFIQKYPQGEVSGTYTGAIQPDAKFLTASDLTNFSVSLKNSGFTPFFADQTLTLSNVQSLCRQLGDIPCPNGTDVDITYTVDGQPLVVSGRNGSITATARLNGVAFPTPLERIETITRTSTSIPEPSSVGGSIVMAGLLGAFVLRRKKLTSRQIVATSLN
ncbi:PEP-CTERM sorting domain-containing protein [Nostoc sp.]|uniref:PEP-CTERM sorting domain-containing protein n=1 Tax=Nostoc sp. TaxID=1180 RepID=UPI002FF9460E